MFPTDNSMILARDILHVLLFQDPGGWFTPQERAALAMSEAALERMVNRR